MNHHDLTYMDCWRFIAPLIPNTIDYAQIFVMTFLALEEAEKRRIADATGKKCEKKSLSGGNGNGYSRRNSSAGGVDLCGGLLYPWRRW